MLENVIIAFIWLNVESQGNSEFNKNFDWILEKITVTDKSTFKFYVIRLKINHKNKNLEGNNARKSMITM